MLRCQKTYENCQEVFHNVKLLKFSKWQVFLPKVDSCKWEIMIVIHIFILPVFFWMIGEEYASFVCDLIFTFTTVNYKHSIFTLLKGSIN